MIILGDIFDRGPKAAEMQRFILELMEQDAVILTRRRSGGLADGTLVQWDGPGKIEKARNQIRRFDGTDPGPVDFMRWSDSA